MCTTCGCSTGELRLEGETTPTGELVRLRPFGSLHAASLGYHFRTAKNHQAALNGAPKAQTQEKNIFAAPDLHFGLGIAHAHAPGLSQGRMVQIEQDILSKNNQIAAQNRQLFSQQGQLALNLLSSPGSGKTTLLTASITALQGHHQISVIEGDQQTSNDAERIRATGAQAIQINTGKGCHLDAAMIQAALPRLAAPRNSVVMIENVGNLVCPASFDLGEAHKVVVLSVTEGEDKPLKYPDMFRAASLMLLNKVDLLPYLNFDVELCLAHARRINPQIQVLQLSATSGQGMAAWLDWVETAFAKAGTASEVAR
jgi:hydrogenase nickel incorporation protein HypB